MKNIGLIASGSLFCSILLSVISCNKMEDTSEIDRWLGETYNQELYWNEDSLAFRRANWTTQNFDRGAKFNTTEVEMWDSHQRLSYLTYSPGMFVTKMGWSEDFMTVENMAKDQSDARFAINGGMFSEDGHIGYFKYDGEVICQNTAMEQGMGAIALIETLDGVDIKIVSCSSDEFTQLLSSDCKYIMATGPVLVNNGNRVIFSQDSSAERTAHSIVGVNSAGDYMFATIDSGVVGHADGATLQEAAFIAELMGMKSAVSMSGGKYSTLWSQEKGILNNPSTGAAEKVASVLYIVPSAPFASGSGTSSSPYVITSMRHLKNMSASLVVGSEVFFELGADLDMAGHDWEPLNYLEPESHNWGDSYHINFDGKGHCLKNMHCSHKSYPSFFGVLYGECRNLKFENAKVEVSTTSPGAILGAYVGTKNAPAIVENCYVTGEVEMTTPGCKAYGGGIAGVLRNGTMRNCYADVDITTPETYSGVNQGIGAIAGDLQTPALLEMCFAKGNVIGNRNQNAGGIAGRASVGTEENSLILRKNIAWNDQVTGRVAVGAICGRVRKAGGGVSEQNYSKKSMIIKTWAESSTEWKELEPYGSTNPDDHADFGIATEDAVQAARTLGWSESVWDLSQTEPSLIMFNE